MKEIMEWVKDILLAVVIAAVILAFFKPIIVQQQSMEPNFHAGDYLITSRQAYRLFGDPQRGDVIVFKSELLDEKRKAEESDQAHHCAAGRNHRNQGRRGLYRRRAAAGGLSAGRSDLRRDGCSHRTGGAALCDG